MAPVLLMLTVAVELVEVEVELRQRTPLARALPQLAVTAPGWSWPVQPLTETPPSLLGLLGGLGVTPMPVTV